MTYPNETEEIGTSPKEGSLALPVPGFRIHEARLQGPNDDAAD